MNIDAKQIVKLLDNALEKYDDPAFLWAYMRGVSDALNVVNSCIGSKEDEKAGEDKNPTSFYFEPISKRYITTKDADLYHAAKAMVRRILTDQLYATVNEWFDLLGLPHIENGDKLGWTVDTMFSISIYGDNICYHEQPVELFPQEKTEDQPDTNNK